MFPTLCKIDGEAREPEDHHGKVLLPERLLVGIPLAKQLWSGGYDTENITFELFGRLRVAVIADSLVYTVLFPIRARLLDKRTET